MNEEHGEGGVSYLTVTGGMVAHTEDRGNAQVLFDYDETGECVGVEFLWEAS